MRRAFAALLLVVGVLLLSSAEALAQDAKARRFAVAVFHFNVQYCAGGLEDFRDDLDLGEVWAGLDATAEGVEDAIIEESFHPLLELFAAHPTWSADFEMQGLMVDVIRARHPETLALMQELDLRVAWDSFHYSDELWTAQPPELIRRSRQATMAAFAEAGLHTGDVVFTQEGQFGMGMGEVLPEGGVAVLPRNLFGLHYADTEREALFSIDDLNVVIGGHSWTVETDDTTIEVRWTFMDDGELLATNDLNPYFLPSFVHDSEAVAAYEQELLDLEAEGFEIVSLRTVVDTLLAAGYLPSALPPVGDGTWQPSNTANVGLWMGDGGGFVDTESDGGVRRRFHAAYSDVQLAQRLVDAGHAQDPDGTLPEAWRQVMLAGVSDATGWNPYRSEVDYSLAASEAALGLAQGVFATLPPAESASVTHYSFDGAQLLSLNPLAQPGRVNQLSGPISAESSAAEGSGVTAQLQWFDDPRYPQASGLQVHFEGLRPGQDVQRELRLHWSEEALHLLPAGRTSGFESVPLSLFSEAEEPVAFPLANGILKVGSSLYAVLDPRTMLLSARVHPDQEAVVFQDSTPSLDPTETWEIYFVTSEALALQLADVLVWNPIRNLPGGNGQPEAGGCGGCGLEGRGGLHQGSAFGPGFALLFLLATSRRRRKPS